MTQTERQKLISWEEKELLRWSKKHHHHFSSSRSVLRKRCSENMQQVYKRTPLPKSDFNKVARNFIEIALRHGCSPVKLLYIFRTPSLNNISERLLLYIVTHVAQLNFYLLIPCSAESVIFLTPDVKSHNRPYIKGHRYLNIPAAESCRFVIVCMTF